MDGDEQSDCYKAEFVGDMYVFTPDPHIQCVCNIVIMIIILVHDLKKNRLKTDMSMGSHSFVMPFS
jgi:hypothetical protein